MKKRGRRRLWAVLGTMLLAAALAFDRLGSMPVAAAVPTELPPP